MMMLCILRTLSLMQVDAGLRNPNSLDMNVFRDARGFQVHHDGRLLEEADQGFLANFLNNFAKSAIGQQIVGHVTATVSKVREHVSTVAEHINNLKNSAASMFGASPAAAEAAAASPEAEEEMATTTRTTTTTTTTTTETTTPTGISEQTDNVDSLLAPEGEAEAPQDAEARMINSSSLRAVTLTSLILIFFL